MGRRDLIIKAIQEFHFWNYGMDGVSSAIEEDLEAQEWIPALADVIIEKLNHKPICHHCGNKIDTNWVSDMPKPGQDRAELRYWHLAVPECRVAFNVSVRGGDADYGGQAEDHR